MLRFFVCILPKIALLLSLFVVLTVQTNFLAHIIINRLKRFLSVDLNVRAVECSEIVGISCLIEHKQHPHTKTLKVHVKIECPFSFFFCFVIHLLSSRSHTLLPVHTHTINGQDAIWRQAAAFFSGRKSKPVCEREGRGRKPAGNVINNNNRTQIG